MAKKAKKKKAKKSSRDVLVVGSKVKAYVKSQGAMSSGELPAALSDAVYDCLDKAIARAQGNKRSTVQPKDLYYDSIVVADPVPPNGPFQLLEMGPNGLQTEFGPGDQGYVGGRWVEDFDGDGVFHYFICPLLGPGRSAP